MASPIAAIGTGVRVPFTMNSNKRGEEEKGDHRARGLLALDRTARVVRGDCGPVCGSRSGACGRLVG
jgi:hypothetical protein